MFLIKSIYSYFFHKIFEMLFEMIFKIKMSNKLKQILEYYKKNLHTYLYGNLCISNKTIALVFIVFNK